MELVEQAWKRITRWLRTHAPSVAERLPAPATDAEFAAVEAEIGMALPTELRASYALHDGLPYGDDALCLFPSTLTSGDDVAFNLLPLEEVAREWDVWRDLIDMGEFDGVASEPEPGIAPVWWSRGWIPVAGNGGGDFLCVDVDPAADGTAGQVICAWHDSPDRQWLASSWGDYLDRLASDMEAGNVRFTEDYGIVRNREGV